MGFFEWMWHRYRTRYFVAGGVAAATAIAIGFIVPVMVILVVAFGWHGTRSLTLVALSLLAAPLACLGGIGTFPGDIRKFNKWAKDGSGDPVALRDFCLLAGQRIAQRGFLSTLPYCLVVNAPAVARATAVRGTVGVVAVGLVAVWAYGAVTFVNGTAMRLLFRPVLEELDTKIVDPTVRPGVTGWSLPMRLGAAAVAIAGATGFSGGLIAAGNATSAEGIFAVTVAATVLVGTYAGAMFHYGVVGPSLDPLHAVTDGIARVRDGDLSRRVPVISTDELGEVAIAFNEMLLGLRQREALQTAFGSYVDPALAERLLTQDSSMFDGELVEATIFFADVRGFSRYAASVEPEEAVAQLNRLFDILVPAIREEHGHANHYTGDGLIAVFGTPEPLPDHADRAVRAAIVIQQRVAHEFGDELRLGIGINTGKVIAGSVGGGGKLDFTVIGDPVNVAARVEELTKETGDRILLTHHTVRALWQRPEGLTERGNRELRGRDGLVELFAVAH